MSENVINPADRPDVEKSKSLGIGKIEGKEIFIVGYQENRGQPSPYTPKDDIGEDGKTDYFTIKTEPSFDLEYRDEGVIPINSFFIKPAQANYIKGIPNYESVNSGGKIGPLKAVKRKSDRDPTKTYWFFATEKDPDF